MDLELYREDPAKQCGGTEIHVGDGTFFVRRWGTPESQKQVKLIRMELFGPMHRYSDDDDTLVFAHWLTEYGVANWEGVYLNNEPLPYSDHNARKVFLNPEYRISLNVILMTEANKFDNFLYDEAVEEIEEIKKW